MQTNYLFSKQKKQNRLFVAVFVLFLLSSYVSFAQDTRNFIKTWSATAPEADPNNLMTRPISDVKLSTNYFDGLGRPDQTVIKEGSLVTDPANPASAANAVDMVSANVYDEFGREVQKYLPYAATTNDGLYKTNPLTDQNTFYTGNSSPVDGQGETYFYAKTDFEPSPLNRPVKTYAPGNSWVGAGRGIETKYWVNTDLDVVRKWTVSNGTSGSFGTYVSTGTYPAGELYKNVTEDENNKQVIEFKDKEGQVILKKVQLTAASDDGSGTGHSGWLCTYYIYDDLNQLRAVIQPKAIETMNNASNWTLDATTLNELMFRYEYDGRGRMIMKKVPGAGVVNMVYDARDRLVMTQDANMPGKWLVTKYDDLNRPIETGLWNDTRSAQTHRDNASATPNPPLLYPVITGTYELLTQTHYDNYTGIPGGLTSSFDNSWSTNYVTENYAETPVASTQTKGMVTWTETKVLGTASTYLYSVNIYDDKGRVIQVKSTNITQASGDYDCLTTQYSWAGQPLISIQKQKKSGTSAQTTVEVTHYKYDGLGRLIQTEKKLSNTIVNSNAMSAYNTIAKLEYDALGQLKKKSLAPAYNNSAGLENLTYDYNIRGWLLGENRDYINQSTTPADKHFGFDLGYDKGGVLGTYTPQYNGNISGTIWKSAGDKEKRKYDFTYDAVNRLIGADFNQYVSGSGTSAIFDNSAGVDFSVSGLSYDANGNIQAMTQNGLKLNTSSPIDQLTYTYQPNSNKLSKVMDAANDNTSKLGDFKYDPATKGSTDYSYDANGNLTVDNNKKISSITYNYLNLPSVITVTGKGTITYTYDAAGNKLKKQTIDYSTSGKTITTTTTYINGFVYESKITTPANSPNDDYTDKLQFIPHEEGRIRPTGNTTQPWAYDYFLKDHLGNVRMVLTDEQKQDQYPAVTFEDANIATEQLYYDDVDVQRTSRPGAFYTSTTNGSKVQLLRKSVQSKGAGQLLKVMAGDKLDIKVDYYIPSATTNNNTANGLNTIINALASIIDNSPVTTTLHGSGTTITDNLDNSTPFNDFLAPQTGTAGTTMPKAYLNIVFFDEQFKFVSENSEAVQVTTEGSGQPIYRIGANAKVAPKNGFVYIYVSNESDNLVYFDNLQVTDNRGPIMEETHYYPFGLTMAGISDKAAGGIENRYKFNDGTELQSGEFSDGSGLELYATNYRSLDPQLGRWWQIDPRPDMAISPYSAMNDNPIRFNDQLGDTLVNDNDIRTAQNMQKDFQKIRNDITKTRDKKNAQIASGKNEKNKPLSEKKIAKLKSQVKNLNDRINEVKKSMERINAVIADPNHGYTFDNIGSNASAGLTFVNSSGYIEMDYTGNTASFAHELAHGSGVAEGIYSIAKNAAGKFGLGLLNGCTLGMFEVRGYRAQYGIDPNTLPNSDNGTPIDMSGITEDYIYGIKNDGNYIYQRPEN